jgi:hypothetical protein
VPCTVRYSNRFNLCTSGTNLWLFSRASAPPSRCTCSTANDSMLPRPKLRPGTQTQSPDPRRCLARSSTRGWSSLCVCHAALAFPIPGRCAANNGELVGRGREGGGGTGTGTGTGRDLGLRLIDLAVTPHRRRQCPLRVRLKGEELLRRLVHQCVLVGTSDHDVEGIVVAVDVDQDDRDVPEPETDLGHALPPDEGLGFGRSGQGSTS